MVNKVNNYNLEKYRNASNFTTQGTRSKEKQEEFLKNLEEQGVVFERSDKKKTEKPAVKVEISSKPKDDFGVNKAQVNTKKAQEEKTVVDMSSNAFDKIAKGIETFVNGVFDFFKGIFEIFAPAGGTETKQAEKTEEELQAENEELFKETVEEISQIVYEKTEEQLPTDEVVDLGYVNTLDDDGPGYTDEDIEKFLKNGDIEGITRVVTNNGRKNAARSTDLTMVYNRNGKKAAVDVDKREEDILRGEKTRDIFMKRV